MRCIFSSPAPPHERTQPRPAVSLLGMWTAQLPQKHSIWQNRIWNRFWGDFWMGWCFISGVVWRRWHNGHRIRWPYCFVLFNGWPWQDSQVEKTTHVLKKGRRMEKVLTLEKLIFLFFYRFWMMHSFVSFKMFFKYLYMNQDSFIWMWKKQLYIA